MKVVIIGGPGTAICIADHIMDAHDRFGMDIEVLGLALDDHSHGDSICGYPILCDIKDLYSRYGSYKDVNFLYLLYRFNKIPERANLLRNLKIPREKFCNFVHPTVLMTRSSRMGVGNVFLANAVVNSNTVFGDYNVVNAGVLIGHDNVIGNCNFFAAHACIGGELHIGNENFIGLNASVKGGIIVGDGNVIGMASNVTKSVESGCLLYGNPAVIKPMINHP